jgi:hypothetical protein
MIYIHSPSITAAPDGSGGTVRVQVEFGEARFELWYSIRGAVPEPRGEAFIAAFLPYAMAYNMPIECELPASPRMLEQLPTIQDIFLTWTPAFFRVPVRAPLRTGTGPESGAVASFLSGGVDSLYTALVHRPELRAVIFVSSFIDRPRYAGVPAEVAARLRAVALDLGCALIEVETNLRDPAILALTEPAQLSPILWNFELCHGAALASIGHLLGPHFGKFYIAAATTYADLYPFGTHPVLDPLWSSESVRYVHDGCSATRIRKLDRIAHWDAGLRALNVCLGRDATGYNCGRCEKCLRTMIGLEIVGAPARSAPFAERLDLLRVALLPNDERSHPYLLENLQAAETRGADPALCRALRTALHPHGMRRRTLGALQLAWQAVKVALPVERNNGKVVWRRLERPAAHG